jgi:transcriptional regulator with XRE-family HTH domain
VSERVPSAPNKRVNDPEAVEMGRRVRKLREATSLSQRDIARELNLTDAAISGWESGKAEPSLTKFKALATLLHSTPEYLAFGTLSSDR